MKSKIWSIAKWWAGLLSVCGLAFSSVGVTPAHAAGIVVNSLLDTTTVDGNCTLREAIQNAENNAATNVDCTAGSGADTITFSVSGVITLGSKLPNIYDTAGIIIDGSGQTLTISGNNVVPVASVSGYAVATINNLTIAYGSTTSNPGGGGIYNSGTLYVTNVTFLGNSAIGTVWGMGGGVYNGGTLTIADCTFSGNNARKGGGIYNGGTLTITNGTFSGSNSAQDGGAIWSGGEALTITTSTFSANSAIGGNGGGGIFSSGGQITITNSVFSGNSANYSRGGAIYSSYDSGYGALTISNSSFLENTATGGQGGGIFVDTRLTITRSTFTNNSAATGGGIYNSGWISAIANSTFSGNSASSDGGGVFNEDTLTIINSTLADNTAPGNGGGIGATTGTVTLRNTILANNTAGNCSGTITNGASNLDSGTTCGWGVVNGSISNANPLLGALTGSPAYFPLTTGSPAIDKGDNPICAAAPVSNQSQNGVTRPQGVRCDIGSYEKPVMIVTRTLTSVGSYDGWLLESSETSGVGGSVNSTLNVFRLGDDAARKQYRAILHFNTGAALPDTAVITSATLKIKKQGSLGANPFTTFGGLRVDMRVPFFGTTAGLVAGDFQSAAGRSVIAVFGATPVSNWYSAVLNTTGRAYISKTTYTQFRLYFTTDDNNNNAADYMQFFSGDYATAGDRPALVIQYYVP